MGWKEAKTQMGLQFKWAWLVRTPYYIWPFYMVSALMRPTSTGHISLKVGIICSDVIGTFIIDFGWWRQRHITDQFQKLKLVAEGSGHVTCFLSGGELGGPNPQVSSVLAPSVLASCMWTGCGQRHRADPCCPHSLPPSAVHVPAALPLWGAADRSPPSWVYHVPCTAKANTS